MFMNMILSQSGKQPDRRRVGTTWMFFLLKRTHKPWPTTNRAFLFVCFRVDHRQLFFVVALVVNNADASMHACLPPYSARGVPQVLERGARGAGADGLHGGQPRGLGVSPGVRRRRFRRVRAFGWGSVVYSC